jgi:hypothetical protein
MKLVLFMHFSKYWWSNCIIYTSLLRNLYLIAYVIYSLHFVTFYRLLQASRFFYIVCVFWLVKVEISNLKYSCEINPFCIPVIRPDDVWSDYPKYVVLTDSSIHLSLPTCSSNHAQCYPCNLHPTHFNRKCGYLNMSDFREHPGPPV